MCLCNPSFAQLPTFEQHPFWGVGTFTSIGYLPPTELGISNSAGSVSVWWPQSTSNAVLQTSASLSEVWSTVTNQPVNDAIHNTRTVTVAAADQQQFFRLSGPETNRIPVFEFAIFYNGTLEFSTAPNMTVNGRVHANGPIYTGSSLPLTFSDLVTTAADISSPTRNGQGPAWAFTGAYNGSPPAITNTPVLHFGLPTITNDARVMIEMPPPGESPSSLVGQLRLYNHAQIALLISNTTVTVRIQSSRLDASPILITYTNASSALPRFITLTNTFFDQRESRTVRVTDIDVDQYRRWIQTNLSVAAKTTTPTVLYVADNRTTMPSQLAAVRLRNGVLLPSNGGFGFTVVTPNPLYVSGNYNCTNATHLQTTNTQSAVKSALISDALTILSPAWVDALSSSPYTARSAVNTTINAAIITGIVPSTGTSPATFSGGFHNVPRLLENWSGDTLWLNTSIVVLYNSASATAPYASAGSYYAPPVRRFNFDSRFTNPNSLPPFTPTMVAVMPSY